MYAYIFYICIDICTCIYSLGRGKPSLSVEGSEVGSA